MLNVKFIKFEKSQVNFVFISPNITNHNLPQGALKQIESREGRV